MEQDLDRETANELVAVIEAKIAALQRGKEAILRMVSGGAGIVAPVSGDALAGKSGTVQAIYRCLVDSGKKIDAAEVQSLLKQQSGFDVPVGRVRQILHQYKGKLWDSPKRGVWKAKDLTK